LAASSLHHVHTFRAAASAAIFHKCLDLLLLLRCEDTPCGEHRFHTLLFHLSAQGVHLIKFPHDRVVIRIIRPQQFAEFNVAQFHIRARLHGSFLRVYTDLMQSSHLLIRETEVLAHSGIFSHAQKVLAATEFRPAAALPTHPALSRPAELAAAASRNRMWAVTPLVLSAATKLMLTLPRIRPLWRAVLSPTDNRRRQQNHQS
jgi:hypothetical protein